MNTDDVIQQIVDTIRDEYAPEKIILFGSRVWGKPHKDSDLDVLVIKETDVRELDRMREVSRLLRRFQQRPYLLPLDVFVKTPSELRYRLDIGDYFIGDIVERGRVAYERGAP
ncbi:MAG: nucleotidyltransferase domain-containing protein [Armatimonadota bacterium]|jgi:predicted nucleotidyltransferase